MRLHQMIGDTILAVAPCLDPLIGTQGPHKLKLLSVDVGGVWVESQVFIERVLNLFSQPDATNSPIFFLPFSSITYLTLLHDSPALSERALGLKP
jgi:hypothetical protein